jgi:hypothetical protein
MYRCHHPVMAKSWVQKSPHYIMKAVELRGRGTSKRLEKNQMG